MKLPRKVLLSGLMWILLCHVAVAQPIITSLDSINKCPDSVVMPVHVENFTGVASLSLKVNYDTTILVYTGYQNQNPLLGGTFLMNGFNNQVIMSWFSLSPASIGNGTLVELKFFYTGKSDLLLAWDDMTIGNCNYTDIDGTDLPAVFEDGFIHATMHTPTLLDPPDQTFGVPTAPMLHWTGSGCAPLYSVEIATDSLFTNVVEFFPSVFGTSLTVQNLELETFYFWRVRAFNALLTTDWSLVSRFKTEDLGIGTNFPDQHTEIHISPNPCHDNTLISIRDQDASDFTIRLYDIRGNLIGQYSAEDQADNLVNFPLSTSSFQKGIYHMLIEAKIKGKYRRLTTRLIVI